MLRRRKRKREEGDLELTTFLNVLVVLMSFLLVTAVFSRIAIQELKLPTAAGGAAPAKPLVTIEVIVRKRGIEIGDGRRIAAAMPKSGDQYDLASLSQHLQQLKSRYSDKTDATILVEPDIPYDDVIRVMDAVKTVHTKRTAPDGREDVQLTALFPDVSIGDAP
ncbi:MAG: biopolymer transporter ExbD [Sulfurifustaceae bacterium]